MTPAEFDRCIATKGSKKVTKILPDGKYVHGCQFTGGAWVWGEVKERKGEKLKKALSKQEGVDPMLTLEELDRIILKSLEVPKDDLDLDLACSELRAAALKLHALLEFPDMRVLQSSLEQILS